MSGEAGKNTEALYGNDPAGAAQIENAKKIAVTEENYLVPSQISSAAAEQHELFEILRKYYDKYAPGEKSDEDVRKVVKRGLERGIDFLFNALNEKYVSANKFV